MERLNALADASVVVEVDSPIRPRPGAGPVRIRYIDLAGCRAVNLRIHKRRAVLHKPY
jgi:hypothetical protein